MLWFAVLFALPACTPAAPPTPAPDADPPSTPPTVPTPTSTPTTPPGPAASNLQWALDPDVGSVVVATWDQADAGPVHLAYRADDDGTDGDDGWRTTPAFDAAPGPQRQVIVGLPFDAAARWQVVAGAALDGAGIDGPPIATGAAPEGLPAPVVTAYDPVGASPAPYLLVSVNADAGGFVDGTYWTVIVDRDGRYVWAHKAPIHTWTLFPQVSASGDHLLWDENTAWSTFDRGAGSRVHRTWLDGELEVVDTPGVQHPLVELPDGTLAWTSAVHGPTEALVEKAPGQDGETVIWTCGDDWAGHFGRYCSSNGLYYDAVTDTYLDSFYTNSTVVSVARSGVAADTGPGTPGATLWWAGTANGSFAFDPPEDAFFWQHGVSYTDDRTLLVSSTAFPFGHTWLREYAIDEGARTITYLWGSDSGVRAQNNGAAWRLPNGNSLHVVGTAGVVREVTADDVEVWRLDWLGSHNLGEGQLVDDLYALVRPRGVVE